MHTPTGGQKYTTGMGDKWQGLLPFIYRHNYGYFSGRSYYTQAHGCCSIFIASQQLLFPYTTNKFEAAMGVAPGHASWWSSNWLNVHALNRLLYTL